MHRTRISTITALLAGAACTAPPPAADQAPRAAPAPETPATPSTPATPATPPTPATPATPETPETPETPPTDAAPAPDPEAQVSAEEAKKLPYTVYAAIIGHESKEWEVDIIHFEGIDRSALKAKLDAMAAREEEPYIDPLPPADLPKGFAVGDPWTLLTLAGNEQRTARSFGVNQAGGSGEFHFAVRLGEPKGRAKGPAIALRGHAPTTARLVAPAPVAASKLGKGTRERVVAALEARLEPDLRPFAKTARFTDEHVKLYPGRFPGGRSHVVFVSAEGELPDGEEANVSGVLFARPGGAIEFHAVAGVWGVASLLGLVDLDGDGFDEVIYEDQYHEGWYVEMIHWKDGEPAARTVTGDGL